MTYPTLADEILELAKLHGKITFKPAGELDPEGMLIFIDIPQTEILPDCHVMEHVPGVSMRLTKGLAPLAFLRHGIHAIFKHRESFSHVPEQEVIQ